jgi:ribosomal protein S12 methylthiotransferase accessory factor
VLHDSWVPADHLKAEKLFRSHNIAWLRGFIYFGEAVIGPLVFPDQQGCSECADTRRLMAGPERKEQFHIKEYKKEQLEFSADPWGSSIGLWQTANLLSDEAQRFLQGGKSRTNEHILLLNLNTFRLSRHFFLPDPYCPMCGDLQKDTADQAKIKLKSSPMTSSNSYRCRSLEELKNVLRKDYFDTRTGLLNFKRYDFLSPFADTAINLPLLTGNELCGGRTHSYDKSELAGILEGLERHCGYAPKGKRTTVYEPYSKVKKTAVDPLSLGVHTDEHYAMPGFPFRSFDSERPIHWVWGYSLSQDQPILVPETFAYYSLGGEEGFVYETSNGCAVGGSLEEAILYGIFEIVERDSFLMTWYGQLPIPRLDLKSIDDLELQLMFERIQAVTGFEVHLFNSTAENGIPSIWALAKNTKDKGINLLCAAGAHLDPYRAVKGAVQELAGMLVNMDAAFEKNRKKYEQMYHDPYLVQHMEDHSMLYGLKEAEKRFSFLIDPRPAVSFDKEFEPVRESNDLLDDLEEVLTIFKQLKLEVIAVDQTSPELKRNGLHCVKVIIPGMLPMTFGHHLSRLKGLERALNVPAKLGFVKKPLMFSELNPYPHPFP